MKSENSFFSFFSNIKDKINSFFTSVTYSSNNDIKDLNYITAKKQYKSTQDNNYMPYLIRKKEKNKSNFHQNKKFPKEINHRYSLSEDYNLSSTLSEISSKENYDLNNTQIDYSCNDNESILSFYNDIEEEEYFKNYYRNNSNILGKKHTRYQFEKGNLNSIYHQEDKQNEKEIKNNKKKKSKTRNEKNYNDVKRLNDEFCAYKKNLKIKNKINKKFQKKLIENDQINIKKIQNNEYKKANKKPFTTLFSTNPERFSLYSTQKKMKLNKKEPYSLLITTENNIMFFPCQNINESKQENKTNGKLNISPVKSCELSKITNNSNDFSFRESYDTKFVNDVNLSTLIDDNNNSSYSIKNNLEKNNINNTFPPINNSYNNSFNINNNKSNIDFYMDVEEYNPLIKNKKQNNESKKNIKANSIQITTNNNPFLFPNNTFEKKIENNMSNNNENVNINSNIPNNKPFFEGKNLFNINGNNNNNISSGLNFSFGKV